MIYFKLSKNGGRKMLKKLLKTVLMLAIILLFGISYVFATDINLNLPSIDANAETNQNSDTTNTESNQNMIDNQTAVNENVVDNTTINSTYDTLRDYETLQPASVNSTVQTGLTTSDIINILLITVGVILILLAIAIMIRLR